MTIQDTDSPFNLLHQFNPAVIYAYFNLDEYETLITPEYLRVERRKDNKVFLLNNFVEADQVPIDKDATVYSKIKLEGSKSVKEFIYSLKSIFEKPDKQVRRGIKIGERVQFDNNFTQEELDTVFDGWNEMKRSDPKVYQILFDDKRYRRCFALKEKGFDIYQKLIRVNGKPYGAIAFALGKDVAFELAFVSLYKDKEMKIINDLNECIIINCFYDLYKNYCIKYVNPGQDAGIKGLKIFKNKFTSTPVQFYTKKISVDKKG